MVPQWKRWLGAAAVLLLVGAGCEATVQPEASVDVEVDAGASGEMEDDGQVQVEGEASSSFDAEADAAVDAMLKEADADAMIEYEEGTDADVVENDKAELDAYGKAYVKSEL